MGVLASGSGASSTSSWRSPGAGSCRRILALPPRPAEILVAGVEFYTTGGATHEAPRFGHFPDAELLRDKRILVVDEVWETRDDGGGAGPDPAAGGNR